ncbi:MAG: DUF1631 family protein, partial [Gammaproteobacteria bacterium]|nr:DUF1631 family protein [Gammaproteobacteria bacterium]
LRNDPVALHFAVATPTGQRHFRTHARIARILDSGNGMGVVFEKGLADDAFDCLIEFAIASGMLSHSAAGLVENRENETAAPQKQVENKQPDKAATAEPPTDGDGDFSEKQFRDKRIDEKDATEILAQLRRVVRRAMDHVNKQFFETADTELLRKARDAGTNAVQMMYFEGLDVLEKNRDVISSSFIGEVLRQIDNVSDLENILERRRRRETGNTTKLEIVDTDQFEEWLAVAEVIAKAENRYSDDLLGLRARLGLVARPWTHKDIVPVGPAVISWSFDDALKELDFRRQVKQDIYLCFENVLIPMLGNLYSALDQLLQESKLFPSVEELSESLQRNSVQRTPSGVRVEPEAYEEMESSVREAAMAADGIATQPRVDHNPFDEPVSETRELFGNARNILGLKRRTQEKLGRRRDDMLAAPDADIGEMFNSNDIMQAISRIETELGDAPLSDRRLKPRLIEILKGQFGDQKAFAEEDYDTLDVMENLVDSIQEDSFLTEGIRDWVQRLEVTLNKLAARDPEFLRHTPERPHSAVQMLNQLARLGNARDARDGIDRDVGRRVDELLQKVVHEFDDNPEVFSEVVGELNPLIDKQTRTYRGNVERTVRTSEGRQKLSRARRAVLDEMGGRLGGKEVPDLLLMLLNPGWRNLMVHTHLRSGVDSSEWHEQLATIDQIWAQLNGEVQPGDDAYIDPEQLLKRVVDGLDNISFDPSKRTPLIMSLSSALVGDTTGRKLPVTTTRIEPRGVPGALGLEGLLPETDPVIESEDEEVRQSWSNAVDRARRIQIGEWLAASDREGRPLILTVAYIGDDSGSFVLVNRKGIKTRELTLQDMADGLHAGQITLLDDYDLPLMERASQRMLENMHNQLTYQASHDDLTQLLNRKEFERFVENAIQDAKVKKIQHAILYLDLDQFKIVNNTSGHSAGDELLKVVADTLTENLADKTAQLARLGGDEYGVLVEDVESVEARDLAEKLLKAIRELRFEWDGRAYTMSASMGLVFLDETMDSVDNAMQFADEACYAAKDAGRNRLQEYEIGDTAMLRRHGAMKWVTELEKALGDDRLILNCQRIAPI